MHEDKNRTNIKRYFCVVEVVQNYCFCIFIFGVLGLLLGLFYCHVVKEIQIKFSAY